MGNDPDKKDKINNEYITFEVIQESLGIKNPNLFKRYLQEVFVDLSTKGENTKTKYLSRLTFYDYIKLPIFISEKLFNSFASSSQQEGLKEEEFVNGFFQLYMGSFQETTKVIFNLLDFDKDGIIKKEDVKIILSYLPLNEVSEEKEKKLESVREVLGFQMQSLEEIDDIVSKTFKKYEDKMNFEQFKETVQNKKSDVLLQLICFLYQEKPFSAKNVESMKLKYGDIEDDEYEKMMKAYGNRSRKGVSVRIKTPNQSSLLSPAGSFFKRRFSIKGFSLNEEENKDKKDRKESTNNNNVNEVPIKDSSKSIKSNLSKLSSADSDLVIPEEYANKNIENNVDPYDKNISMVRLNNERTLEDYNKLKKGKEGNSKNNLKELMDNSRQRYSSPTKYLQEKAGLNSLALMNKDFNYDKNLCPINEVENEFGNNGAHMSALLLEQPRPEGLGCGEQDARPLAARDGDAGNRGLAVIDIGEAVEVSVAEAGMQGKIVRAAERDGDEREPVPARSRDKAAPRSLREARLHPDRIRIEGEQAVVVIERARSGRIPEGDPHRTRGDHFGKGFVLQREAGQPREIERRGVVLAPLEARGGGKPRIRKAQRFGPPPDS